MRGHLLGVFQPGFGVFEVGRDAGAPEGVIADAGCGDAGLLRPASDHRPGPLPVETGGAERFGLAVYRAEEGAVLVALDPGGPDIGPVGAKLQFDDI